MPNINLTLTLKKKKQMLNKLVNKLIKKIMTPRASFTDKEPNFRVF